jgi:hypothetical protein
MREQMKHIKKKTIGQLKIDNPSNVLPPSFVKTNTDLSIEYNKVKDKHAYIVYESGDMYRHFFYNDNGIACSIPFANPVLVYFHFSQTCLKPLSESRHQLLSVFANNKSINENALKIFYDYFGVISSFIIMLMTALEAFINQNITDDFIYLKNEGGRCTKSYDKDQIQRWIVFEEKIKNVLNKIKGKNFEKEFPLKYQRIRNLKELRDDIAHTKQGEVYGKYQELYKKTLDFKCVEAINVAKDFINFYEGNLIEPCPCGADW